MHFRATYRRHAKVSHDLWSAYPLYGSAIEKMARCRLPKHEPLRDADADVWRFDEEYFLLSNQDVAEAVAIGHWPSGLCHFMVHGFYEGRVPCAL